METIDEILAKMKGQQMIYNDIVVTILGYCIGVGEKGQDVEIYLNSGQTIYTDICKVFNVIKKFHPIHEQAVILQKQEEKKLTVCSGVVVAELRDMMLDQLRQLKTNPTKEVIAQSKAINETISQFTNLARAELEYKKFALVAMQRK